MNSVFAGGRRREVPISRENRSRSLLFAAAAISFALSALWLAGRHERGPLEAERGPAIGHQPTRHIVDDLHVVDAA